VKKLLEQGRIRQDEYGGSGRQSELGTFNHTYNNFGSNLDKLLKNLKSCRTIMLSDLKAHECGFSLVI